jgi:formylmethanofuran dehydrogenase subunit C
VSDRVTLVARHAIGEPLETEGLTPDRLVTLSETAIAQLPVWSGRRAAQLGEFFEVRGSYASSVVVQGAGGHVHGIGEAMTGGTLTVEGDAGNLAGAGMSGGVLDVRGSIGDDGGAGMSGGVLEVVGSCGDRLGAARPGAPRGMTGGEIIVRGRAGNGVAASCRRGLLVVFGDVGTGAAHGMIAGSLFVFGRAGAGAGQFNKRGSLVSLGGLDVLATYRYACTYRPPHVRMTLLYLARRYGLAIDAHHVGGHYRRYCGDLPAPGKGEILVWSEAAERP